MKKDWKYILYLVVAVVLLVAIKLLSPKQYDWRVTFSHTDQNPYGAYALAQLLPSVFKGNKVDHSYQTIYEIKDSLKLRGNILAVSNSFQCGETDAKALLAHVDAGGSALISAQYFWGSFRDTLAFSTKDYFFNVDNDAKDSASLHFVPTIFDSTKRYHFRRDNIHNYFNRFDTTRTTVIAVNDSGDPVTIKIKWGKGTIILNCTPLAFTNIYLLAGENNEFVSNTLSYLPTDDVQWTEYYHVGRMESRTPLRFLLRQESLRWAYYLTIVTLLVYMLFEMKRRQRIIPVIQPLTNTSLEFVNTIGNLYYQNKEHKSIAEKKILFFLEQVRTRYFISTSKIDNAFIETVSKKAGRSTEEVSQLFRAIDVIRSSASISANQLLDLNRRIEKFL